MRQIAILVAGGRGQRMGAAVPKQFLSVGGRPVLMHTIDAFRRALPDIRLILVLPHDQQEEWHALCGRHQFAAPALVADGGATRFHSVQNGLALCADFDDKDLVGIHDGVRPFVAPEVLRRAYDEAREYESAVPVVPVVETMRHIAPDGTTTTVPRDEYRLVQTPQVFRLGLLREAYRQPFSPRFTDDASVVEALGGTIHLVEGNRENIKLTTPSDILLAEHLCQQWK